MYLFLSPFHVMCTMYGHYPRMHAFMYIQQTLYMYLIPTYITTFHHDIYTKKCISLYIFTTRTSTQGERWDVNVMNFRGIRGKITGVPPFLLFPSLFFPDPNSDRRLPLLFFSLSLPSRLFLFLFLCVMWMHKFGHNARWRLIIPSSSLSLPSCYLHVKK